jgi:ABC-type Na+ transport system ATPase subunit NatA
MPQQLAVYNHLAVRENLCFLGEVYGLSSAAINNRSRAAPAKGRNAAAMLPNRR